ncbi:MAG: mocA [Planctomycetaceae bacterium]|nr:mocA [Planctomycetaceae bacterium]
MGQPKLLLPWRGTTVIAHLVGELQAAGVLQIFVVLRSSDAALHAAVVAAKAIPLQPTTDPPDMRSSVEFGLSIAATAVENLASRGWLLIPADHPIVSRTTVTALQASFRPGIRQILIPTYAGQRGHPTLFSSDFAAEVASIPADCGLNWLVRQNAAAIQEVPVADSGVIVDLDTPEDYQALLNRIP